jgi:mutator protein MutT
VSLENKAFNEQIPVVCGIVFKHGKILFVKRRDEELLEADGKWELPGGKIEFGENPEHALLREIYEETGYRAQVESLLPLIYTNVWEYSEKRSLSGFRRQVFLICYICSALSGEKRLSDSKVSKIKWFSPEEVKSIQAIKGTAEILEEFKKSDLFKNDPVNNISSVHKKKSSLFLSKKPYEKQSQRRNRYLKEGKIPGDLLKELIDLYSEHGFRDKSVLIGPLSGEDSAALQLESDQILITSDPITFVTKDISDFSFNVNANDIAAMGGIPKYLSLVYVLPPLKVSTSLFMEWSLRIAELSKEAGVSIIGGHTEISSAVNNPVVVGQMIGIPGKCGIIRSSGARSGDILLMTKSAGLEGTAIIATEFQEYLTSEFGAEFVNNCRMLLRKPGISILNESKAVVECAYRIHQELLKHDKKAENPLHAMHDVTEGGIATGAWEISELSGTGLFFQLENVPVREETRIICRRFDMDPLGLISSGVLLFALNKKHVKTFKDYLNEFSFEVAEIGEFIDEKRCFIKGRNSLSELPRFESDEIVKALSLLNENI